MTNCCSDCNKDCLWPWKKEKYIPPVEVEIEHQYRGRISSETSISQMENPIPAQVITQQPQPETVELEKPKNQKKSLPSLESAILASSSGILTQIFKEKKSSKDQEGPQSQISLTYDESCQGMVIFLISVKGYHSMFLINPSTTFNRTSSENSPLLNPSPSLIMRISIEPARNQIIFTSIHSKTRNPIWKEKMLFDIDNRNTAEQKLFVVLYESNRFSRWSAVKFGEYPLKDVIINGTHNLSIDLEPINFEVQAYGEMKLCLCYNKTSSRIFCDIIEVRSLFHWALNKKMEYYVKVYFFDKKKQIKVKKSSALKPDVSSLLEINETIRAKVSIASLNNISIRISICDGKQIMGDSCLYYLTFGEEGSSGSMESTYWSDFIRDIPSSGRKQWFSVKQK